MGELEEKRFIKRYLLFAGQTYYPNGGWDDFIIDCDTARELRKLISFKIRERDTIALIEGFKNDYHWLQIIDTKNKKEVNIEWPKEEKQPEPVISYIFKGEKTETILNGTLYEFKDGSLKGERTIYNKDYFLGNGLLIILDSHRERLYDIDSINLEFKTC